MVWLMSKPIAAPEWLKRRMQAVRQQPPLTSAQVRTMAQASTHARQSLEGRIVKDHKTGLVYWQGRITDGEVEDAALSAHPTSLV